MKRIIFFALLAHSFGVLAYRWNQPLIGPHGFRQTQTAISTYWMLRGSPLIDYWTPVMGPPWSIPFEFPLMQWLTALVALAGVHLDAAGRLVSWSFGIATLWPLTKLATRFGADPWLTASLYLASPVYLYWGTDFLIETTALFLAMTFLVATLEERWTIALTCGALAALVKLPALLPFAALSLLLPALPSASSGRTTPTPLKISLPSGEF